MCAERPFTLYLSHSTIPRAYSKYTLTRLATAMLTACTGRDRSGIAFPSSASSWRITNRETWNAKCSYDVVQSAEKFATWSSSRRNSLSFFKKFVSDMWSTESNVSQPLISYNYHIRVHESYVTSHPQFGDFRTCHRPNESTVFWRIECMIITMHQFFREFKVPEAGHLFLIDTETQKPDQNDNRDNEYEWTRPRSLHYLTIQSGEFDVRNELFEEE